MSVLAKARTYERGFPWFLIDIVTQYQEHGPDYIHALLNGYKEAPPASSCRRAATTTSISPATPSRMPPPLQDGQVDLHGRRAADGRSIRQATSPPS